MLKCNLKVLLAERNLKITQVSNDTGISRTTLTSLTFGYAKGIQFDTMNTLCNYLKITPKELFIYIPYDIEIKLEHFKYDDKLLNCFLEFSIILLKENKKYQTFLFADVEYFYKKFKLIIEQPEIEDEEDKKEFDIIKDYLEKLPVQFFLNIENELKEKILFELNSNDFLEQINKKENIEYEEDKIKEEDISIIIEWDFLNK